MEALKKKKECNDKAQAVVEKLLDPFDDEDKLLIMVNIFPEYFLRRKRICYQKYFRLSCKTSTSVTTRTLSRNGR